MESTSTTPLQDFTDEDEPPPQGAGSAEKRKRSSRACDQCRKIKSKCERSPGSVACRNCISMQQECTFLGPSRKRGPPKGYITALETRVHRLEALWGVLLASPDSRSQALLEDMAQDGLARDILGEVENGLFGPVGRARAVRSQEYGLLNPGFASGRSFTSSRTRREQVVVGNEDPYLPDYVWQDRLVNHLVTRDMARRQGKSLAGSNTISAPYAFAPEGTEIPTYLSCGLALPPVQGSIPSLGSFSLASRYPQDAETIWHTMYDREVPSSGEESEYDSDDSADAVGQLSLNEKQQVGYLGKTSGMHLLAKPQRSDDLNDGGIWHLPQSRYWPKSQRGRPMIEDDLHLDIPFPPQETQDHLLSLYWIYVQPVLPVLDKAKFLAEYNTELGRPVVSHSVDNNQSRPTKRVPRLLLLAMFTIASRYSDIEPPPPEGNMWEAGCDFLDHAKLILNWTYDSPRPSTCQALLLLAYREFGIGAISQAWIYMGMAIRMATDLGMHRAADRWQRSGRVLFSEAEKSSRKRLWHCCIILDRIMAFSMGRPMYIRERDYDTPLPSTDDDEEREAWTPRSYHEIGFRPTCTLSTLNAGASLSSILALIVDTIYACRSGVSFVVRHVESFKMAARLDDWYHEIPEHLKYDLDLNHTIPLPHILTLHMMYWCVVMLVHRPFIRHHKHIHTHTSISEDEIGAMSEKSFAHSSYAASRVSSLVDMYRRTWDLSRANAFVSWYVLSAGVMHVATLTMDSGDQDQAKLGLQRCLDAFDRMKLVWPSSARAWQLLRGAELDLAVPSSIPSISQVHHQPPMSAFGSRPDTMKPVPPISHTHPVFTPHAHDGTLSQPPEIFPSLTNVLNRDVHGPAPNMSYFPGYDHWPPESLVFEPPFLNMGHEDVKPRLPALSTQELSEATAAYGLPAPLETTRFGVSHDNTSNSEVTDPNNAWHWRHAT